MKQWRYNPRRIRRAWQEYVTTHPERAQMTRGRQRLHAIIFREATPSVAEFIALSNLLATQPIKLLDVFDTRTGDIAI